MADSKRGESNGRTQLDSGTPLLQSTRIGHGNRKILQPPTNGQHEQREETEKTSATHDDQRRETATLFDMGPFGGNVHSEV